MGLPGLSAIAITLIIGSLILVAWRRRSGRTGGFRGSASGAAMGNALMDLNSAFMPNHASAAVVCMLEEEEVRDDAGEGPTPWTPPAPKIDSPYRADADADADDELLN